MASAGKASSSFWLTALVAAAHCVTSCAHAGEVTLSVTAQGNRLIAILPLDVTHAKGKMDGDAEASLEEMLRDETTNAVGRSGWKILSGQTMLQLLQDNGIDPTKCGEGSCQLTSAREIKVEMFISGSVQFVDGKFSASIRLIDTKTGTILASERMTGKNTTALQDAFDRRAGAFFTRAGLQVSKPDALAPPQPERLPATPQSHSSKDAPQVSDFAPAKPPAPTPAMDASSPHSNPVEDRQHWRNRLFSLVLPYGWSVSEQKDSGKDGAGSDTNYVIFKDSLGNYFDVVFDQSICQFTCSLDALWSAQLSKSGVVAKITESPFKQCRKGDKIENEESSCKCPVGDGRLDIGVTIDGGDPHGFFIYFGNEKSESASTAMFRSMLSSFQTPPESQIPPSPSIPEVVDTKVGVHLDSRSITTIPEGKPQSATLPVADGSAEKVRDTGQWDLPIVEAAKKYDVPPELVRAVIVAESNFDPDAISPAGARGLMQLMPSIAGEMYVRDLTDPVDNIYGGTRYLRILANMFGGDLTKTIAAYHAGPEAVRKASSIPADANTQTHVKGIPSDEGTQEYVKRVVKLYRIFKGME